MSDKNLRSKLIRLAHANPKLRPALLPLLTEGRGKQAREQYQQTAEEMAMVQKGSQTLRKLASMLGGARVDSGDRFLVVLYDADGIPTVTSWEGEVAFQSSNEKLKVTVRITNDKKRGTFKVDLSPDFYALGSQPAAAANAIGKAAPFELPIPMNKVPALLDQVAPRVLEMIEAAESTNTMIDAKIAAMKAAGVKFGKAADTLLSRFGWSAEYWSGTFYKKDGKFVLTGTLVVSGLVTPEIGAMGGKEQQAALAPLVTKVRAQAKKATTVSPEVEIIINKAYFTQNVLHVSVAFYQ